MKISDLILSENFPFLVVKFSVYLNRRVFVMKKQKKTKKKQELNKLFEILGHFTKNKLSYLFTIVSFHV